MAKEEVENLSDGGSCDFNPNEVEDMPNINKENIKCTMEDFKMIDDVTSSEGSEARGGEPAASSNTEESRESFT